MSGQPFTFPPPPPPPPRRTNVGHESSELPTSRSQDRGRGRAGYGRGQRGSWNRDAGTNRSHGPDPYAYTTTSSRYARYYRAEDSHHAPSRHGSHAAARDPNNLIPVNKPFKRDHEAAFNTPAYSQARPRGAPPVPSFNADIGKMISTMESKSKISPPVAPKNQNKSNSLGLNPVLGEVEANSEDDDEEANAATHTSSTGYEFEYRGQTSALRSAAEIAAWLIERKKRYPTAARVEVAKKEAEARKKQIEAARQEQQEAARQRHEQQRRLRDEQVALRKSQSQKRSKLINQDERPNALEVSGNAPNAVMKTEKLRQKAEKAARALSKAEKALQKAQDKAESCSLRSVDAATSRQAKESVGEDSTELLPPSPSLFEVPAKDSVGQGDGMQTETALVPNGPDPVADTGMPPENSVESDTTSSSGSDSFESDSDGSGPEQITTNQQAPLRVQPPKREVSNQLRPPDVCRYFWQSAKCKYGDRCRYKHERRQHQSKTGTSKTLPRRKRLWDVLVENEKKQQHEQMLRAIIALGKRGVLDEVHQPR